MDTLLTPVKLHPQTTRVLDEISTGAHNPLAAVEPGRSDELIARHIRPLLEATGMLALARVHYGWFLRELARIWRAKTGRELAFHLELCIRKWINLGLEPNTVQFLVTEIHERLKAEAAGNRPQITQITPMPAGQERECEKPVEHADETCGSSAAATSDTGSPDHGAGSVQW